MACFYPVRILFSVLVCAVALAAQPCHARDVRIGIGFSIAPYVIREQNNGMEVDTIRMALEAAGHRAIFVYLPNLRLPIAFAEDAVDGVATNVAYDLAKDSKCTAYGSDNTVTMQNYAISLERRELVIPSIEALSAHKVMAFNNAAKYLGPVYAAMVRNNNFYSEHADQSLQVRMLFTGRVDVIVSGKRIFQYWRRKLRASSMLESVNLSQPVRYSPIFQPSPRHVAFKDSDLRDDFNRGLSIIKQSGAFDAITEKYVGVDAD